MIAWDAEVVPRIVFATGHTDGVFQQKAGALFGQAAGALFSGGERAAKDLAALCQNVPVAEQRPMLRGGKPFAALERWQTSYLPVYSTWAAIVVIVFPPLFAFA